MQRMLDRRALRGVRVFLVQLTGYESVAILLKALGADVQTFTSLYEADLAAIPLGMTILALRFLLADHEHRLDEAIVQIEGSSLSLLTAGSAHPRPAELLVTSAMRRIIDELRSVFDFIVIDTPAMQPLADVGSLTPFVDSVLLVARAGMTSKAAARTLHAAKEGI